MKIRYINTHASQESKIFYINLKIKINLKQSSSSLCKTWFLFNPIIPIYAFQHYENLVECKSSIQCEIFI
jgi:hypothetical protein